MERHRRTEPEPVQIELIALDGATNRGLDASRPPPAGVGTMPPISHLVGTVLARVADVPDPPLLPGSQDRPVWSDQRIHRLVRLSPWDAAEALQRIVPSSGSQAGAVISAHTRRPARVRIGRHARLELRPVEAEDGPMRLDGRLHLHRWGRPTPVVLTLHPWSAHRSDLCLEPHRGRFGTWLPRRYYDVAHVVMDVLWHQIERVPPGLTSPRRREP